MSILSEYKRFENWAKETLAGDEFTDEKLQERIRTLVFIRYRGEVNVQQYISRAHGERLRRPGEPPNHKPLIRYRTGFTS